MKQGRVFQDLYDYALSVVSEGARGQSDADEIASGHGYGGGKDQFYSVGDNQYARSKLGITDVLGRYDLLVCINHRFAVFDLRQLVRERDKQKRQPRLL